jgi:predicted CXXCH cytochrome family protein
VTGTISLTLLLALSGCGDEIVYRDRATFETPPTGAGGFLGLSDVAATRTVCGNCHSGKQAQWMTTRHSKAWATLKNSGQQKPECESCHSVSSLGNVQTDANVGWVATKAERYQNVQCESCHGPGQTHVLNPDINANKPLPSIQVGATLTNGCGECHSGSHRPFAEEWAKSRHGKKDPDHNRTDANCVSCHEAKGILAAWGVTTNYVEQSKTEIIPVTCVVCHDPHNLKNPGQLRFSVDTPDLATNLCMKCHYKRAAPEVKSSQGPHSPQGPMLLGDAGWVPPNFQYPAKSLVGSHGSDRNPKLCATCHVNNYQVSDKLTGAFTFRATGHSFQALPCVDAQGVPTGQASTDVCGSGTRPNDVAQRSFKACVSCHLSETAARSALLVTRQRLERLAVQVDSMLLQVPVSEISTADNRISTAEGAKFNAALARQWGSAAHNPFLAEALLLASIQQITTDYGIRVSSRISLSPELAPPPR